MSGTIFLESTAISVSEKDDIAYVTIIREGDTSQAVEVLYGITPATSDPATLNLDYTVPETTDTALIPVGENRVSIPISIIDDDDSEPTEAFVISLINVNSGSLLAPRTMHVYILDDENPVGTIPDPSIPPSDYSVVQEAVITNINQVINLDFSPIDPALAYIATKEGMIDVYNWQTRAFITNFTDLTDEVNDRQDRGLLDIAIHPDFSNHPYLYAFYVVDPPETASLTGNAGPDGGGNRFSYVVRLEADPASNYTTLKPGTESKVILVGGAGQSLSDISGDGIIDSTNPSTSDPNSPDYAPASDIDPNTGEFIDDYIKVDARSHAGGSLAFGPDGKLYISTGDGTSYNFADPRAVSVQNIDSLAGKILRVDPLTGQGLSDNPFFESGDSLDSNNSKVYQLGLRNPFSITFDQDGQLIIADTGWNAYEEINISEAGANFGWPFYEGGDGGVLKTNSYQALPEADTFFDAVANGDIEITPAFRAFARDTQLQTIIGGDVVYTGSQYPDEFKNDYFFSDFSNGRVYSIDLNDRRDIKLLYTTDTGLGPIHFVQGPDDFVYYVDIVKSEIGRLIIKVTNPYPGIMLTKGNTVFDEINSEYILTPAENWQSGTVMSANRIDLNHSAHFSFDFFLGTKDADGADGFGFLLHNDPAGVNAIGSKGGFFGLKGIKDGLAIEFDTYNNGASFNDIPNDHTMLFDTDGSFTSNPINQFNLEDGEWHNATVTWDPTTSSFTYTVDDQLAETITNINIINNFLGESNLAYFGFAGATGGLNNLQKIKIKQLDVTWENIAKNMVIGGDAFFDQENQEYILTTEADYQLGTLMSTLQIDLNKAATFNFDLFVGSKDADGADGLGFVLHNDPAGPNAQGNIGGALGLMGITNGLAIEFDTYDNGTGSSDLPADHTTIFDTDGSFTTTPFALNNLENGQWHNVTINWNPTSFTLSNNIDGIPAGTITEDIVKEFLDESNFAYFGFAGTTGGLNNLQKIKIKQLDVTWKDTTHDLFMGGSTLYNNETDTYILTPAENWQAGTIMSNTRIDLSSAANFSFDFFLGTKDTDGADGFGFLFHNDPAGVNAIGAHGGFFGLKGIKDGLAVEFDSYNNGASFNDIPNDHTMLFDTDGSFTSSPIDQFNLEDGEWHSASVSWDPTTSMLSYTVDDQLAETITDIDIINDFLGGSELAYFGFAGATGGLNNFQMVKINQVDVTWEEIITDDLLI